MTTPFSPPRRPHTAPRPTTHTRTYARTGPQGETPEGFSLETKNREALKRERDTRVRAREESLQQQKREKKGALAFLVALSFYARSHCNSLFPYELSNLGWPMLRVRRV